MPPGHITDQGTLDQLRHARGYVERSLLSLFYGSLSGVAVKLTELKLRPVAVPWIVWNADRIIRQWKTLETSIGAVSHLKALTLTVYTNGEPYR